MFPIALTRDILFQEKPKPTERNFNWAGFTPHHQIVFHSTEEILSAHQFHFRLFNRYRKRRARNLIVFHEN